MSDEIKKRLAKKLARMRSHSDELWAIARDSRTQIEAAVTKRGSLTTEEMTILRLAGGIVLAQLMVNACDVEASKYLTPNEEDRYGDIDT